MKVSFLTYVLLYLFLLFSLTLEKIRALSRLQCLTLPELVFLAHFFTQRSHLLLLSLSLSLSLSRSYSRSLSLTLTLTHAYAHTHGHSHAYAHNHAHSHAHSHSRLCSLSRSLSLSRLCSYSRSLSLSLWSLSFLLFAFEIHMLQSRRCSLWMNVNEWIVSFSCRNQMKTKYLSWRKNWKSSR